MELGEVAVEMAEVIKEIEQNDLFLVSGEKSCLEDIFLHVLELISHVFLFFFFFKAK